MLRVGCVSEIKATGEKGRVTTTNGHAHKVCGKWYQAAELQESGMQMWPTEVGPERWGMTLEQFKACREEARRKYEVEGQDIFSKTMRNVVDEYIVPKTKGTGMSLALSLNQDRPIKAEVMISHSWDANFQDFYLALLAEELLIHRRAVDVLLCFIPVSGWRRIRSEHCSAGWKRYFGGPICTSYSPSFPDVRGADSHRQGV